MFCNPLPQQLDAVSLPALTHLLHRGWCVLSIMPVSVTEKIVAPRPYQPLHEHDVRSAEFGIDDMPVLMPHPSSLPPERPNARRSYNEPPKKGEEARPETAAAPTALASPQPPPSPVAPPEPAPAKPIAPPVEDPDDDWGEGIL